MVRGWTPAGTMFSGPIQTGPRPTHFPIWRVAALFAGGNAAGTLSCPPIPFLTPSFRAWVICNGTALSCPFRIVSSARLTHKPDNLPQQHGELLALRGYRTGYNGYNTWIVRRNSIVRLCGLERKLLDVKLNIKWDFTGATLFFCLFLTFKSTQQTTDLQLVTFYCHILYL